MRGLLFLGLLVFSAACREEEQTCGTAACRQEAVLVAWSEDPTKGATAIAALPDEVERSAAVARIIETDPRQVALLCDALPEGKLRVRCQRTKDRPHLWEGPVAPVADGQGATGGSLSHRLAPDQSRVSVFHDVSGDLGICTKAGDAHTCAWARAIELGALGKFRDAAARCAAIEVADGEAELWQAECRMSAAEAGIRGQGEDGYAGAAELCLGAGRFQERCLIHLARELAARTPSADSAPGAELNSTVAAAASIERFWGEDASAAKFVDHFWSLAMGYAFMRADAVTGDLLDGVPANVRPHVHAAAAWKLMQLDASGLRSLSDWAKALDSRLAVRAGLPKRPLQAVHMPGVGNLWTPDVKPEPGVPAVIYLGMGSRGTSKNAKDDRLICILEAAARQDPPLQSMIVEGTQHPSPGVRWTALRLQKAGSLPAKIKLQPGN